jgi:hypothetical protein
MRQDLLSQPRSNACGADAPTGTLRTQSTDGVPPLRNAVRSGLTLADRVWWRLSRQLIPSNVIRRVLKQAH